LFITFYEKRNWTIPELAFDGGREGRRSRRRVREQNGKMVKDHVLGNCRNDGEDGLIFISKTV
jgi:hypothetical protein